MRAYRTGLAWSDHGRVELGCFVTGPTSAQLGAELCFCADCSVSLEVGFLLVVVRLFVQWADNAHA